MKRRSLAMFMIGIICCLLISGCGSKSADKPERTGENMTDTNNSKDEVKSPKKKKTEKKETDKKASLGVDLTKDSVEYTDYEAVYEPVFTEILDIIDYGYNTDREYDYATGSLTEQLNYGGMKNPLEEVGYRLEDINGDGIPELLIGYDADRLNNGGESYITGIYTVKDGKPFTTYAGSARDTCQRVDETHLFLSLSGGVSLTVMGEFHLSDDGCDIIWDDCYFTDEKDDGSTGFYHNKTGIVDAAGSEEMENGDEVFYEIIDDLAYYCIRIEWTPIGDRSVRDESDNPAKESEPSGPYVEEEPYCGVLYSYKELQDSGKDPLEGLVSNDILTKFRESNSVQDPGSIESEALALGGWVQKNIGKIPKSVREKGDEIGRHYEFWFGTDVGNNFDANFTRIYKTYYCLKDYYTSDGRRSRDFYERVSEENDFLGNGKAENIEKMYSDMGVFITDCNNIIRNK
jgi:hypothetical protein